jgi:redox-sensing transcriptional repressor rex
MARVIKHEKIEYAILAVADKSAQSMADKLVDSGIKGIVNMTNVVIKVSNGVKVENLSIINALNLIK